MNVVVWSINGLNCHWLGPYGNEWIETPGFDRLACESVIFDRCYSVGSLLGPAPSAAATAILIDDRKDRSALPRPWSQVVPVPTSGFPTPGAALLHAVAEVLARPRPEPWLIWIESDRMLPPWDLEQETYEHYATLLRPEGTPADDDPPKPIDQPTEGPVAVEDDRLWRQLHHSFAAAVSALDQDAQAVFDSLRAAGLDQSAVWVITSGFGFPLGEHGVVGRSASRLHEEWIHVPLMVRLPQAREALRRVPAIVQAEDLAPALDAWLRDDEATGLPALAVGRLTSIRSRARLTDPGAESNAVLRTDDWAYLPPHGDQPARLYRKPDDIWEVNDLAPRQPEECDRLAELLNNG